MMGIMQAPGDPKKKLLTPKRVNEIADSLDKEANVKKAIGNTNKKIAEAFIKKGKGNETVLGGETGRGFGAITANERLQKSKKDLEESAKDALNADRYRKLAQAKNKQ